ncbi:sialate O-acetylesterase isoform X2 [Leuresthes tenuis]|uniref:sialate O-acetylesterase isoform X2 n=1 Tax=Leuresthes tenuis TaxID=355514 RepID=UPI003B513D23
MDVVCVAAFVILLTSFYCGCDGNLRFASYYGDHMVLQKSPQRAVLWGYFGSEGAHVTVSLSGPINQKTSSAAVTEGTLEQWAVIHSARGAWGYGGTSAVRRTPAVSFTNLFESGNQTANLPVTGRPLTTEPRLKCSTMWYPHICIWKVTLNPVDAGGPYTVTAASDNSTVNLTDVMFGDIWLCGGQSNMYFPTSQIFNASEELSLSPKYPHVRPFMAALRMNETELIDLIEVQLPWSVPTASVVGEFSAVCWLFGRYMYDKLKYPIGLVESCWGGTPVEAWSSLRALRQCGLEQNEDSPKEKNSVLWNAMIHPLLSMTIYGAIWYQGEANADYHRDKYNCSFPALIDDWRMAFHQGSGGQTALDFPFGFVQLDTYKDGPTDDGFAEIRWHQTADVGFVPNPRMKKTFMAVAFDLPDKTSPYGTIHPRDKQDVAYRLTLGARAVAYGEKDVPFLGPFPKQIVSTDVFVIVTYDRAASVTPSKDIFEIFCSVSKHPHGPKSQWVPAAIETWGPTTVLLSATYCQPPDEVTALRYAWKDSPCDFKACPIYSATGILPAPPFIVSRYSDRENTWKS